MRAIRTALIMAIVVTAVLFGIGQALDAAPVVKLSQVVQRQVCNGDTCTLIKDIASWSGTCVGRDESGKLLIVSCGHGMKIGQPMLIEVEDGVSEQGSILRLSQKPDLSLIAVDHPAPVKCFPIGDVVPKEGTAVQLIGYPGGQFRSRQASIDQYCFDRQQKTRFVELSLPCADGESGGGIIVAGRLSGVIVSTLDTRHPMARFYKNHSFGVPLDDVQGFVVGALGYQPLTDGLPAQKRSEKAAEVPAPEKLDPVPHPEPLPGLRIAEDPAPADPLPTHDDIRGIVSDELSKLTPDIKAELVKQWGLHAADVKQAVTASVAAGKIDPASFTPILESAAKGAAEDAGNKVAEQLAPSLLGAVAQHLGLGALAGSIGGPVGIAACAAISVVGFFLHRTMNKHMQGAANALGRAANALTPGTPTQPPPSPGVVLDTTNTATRDETWRVAYARAKQAFAQKEPASIGSVKMFESLFNQYLGGLKHDAVE